MMKLKKIDFLWLRWLYWFWVVVLPHCILFVAFFGFSLWFLLVFFFTRLRIFFHSLILLHRYNSTLRHSHTDIWYLGSNVSSFRWPLCFSCMLHTQCITANHSSFVWLTPILDAIFISLLLHHHAIVIAIAIAIVACAHISTQFTVRSTPFVSLNLILI